MNRRQRRKMERDARLQIRAASTGPQNVLPKPAETVAAAKETYPPVTPDDIKGRA